MSDLIERLRDREFFSRTGERHELLAAADRIEALEAAHEQDTRLIKEFTTVTKLSANRIEALEAALRDISICRYPYAANIARAALAERDQTP